MTETVEQIRATVFAAGRYTCTGCGRTNETGEGFHYRGLLEHYCTPCCKVYDQRKRAEMIERIKEDEDDEPADTQRTDEITCPYCGYQISDSWEIGDDEGKMECEECEREFSYGRNYEVTYSTSRITESGE